VATFGGGSQRKALQEARGGVLPEQATRQGLVEGLEGLALPAIRISADGSLATFSWV